jgi:ATP-dependent RNA helicase DDX51/DBP6
MSEYGGSDAVSGVKRKRITFNDTDDVAPTPTLPTTAAPGVGYMNPERLAALQRDPSSGIKPKKVKKDKTVAKQRYLKKKMQKRKKRLKAAKDSAPKSKKEKDGVVDGANDEESEDGDDDSSDSDEDENDEEIVVKPRAASTLPAPTTSAYPAVAKPTKKNSVLPVATPAAPTSTPVTSATFKESVVPPEDETVEQRRERRRQEKKAKREERRAEEARLAEKEKERLKLVAEKEREKKEKREAAKQKAAVGKQDEDVDMESVESDSKSESDDEEEEDGSSSSSSGSESDAESSSSTSSNQSKTSINPDGIPSFPLPQAPAKPSQTLLSRQGLPSALRDAVLVQEDDKVKLDQIKLLSRRKRRAGDPDAAEGERLGDRIKERLRHLGIEDFFAVQTALIPELASLPLVPFAGEMLNDFLVSAPTGSGKTLAYGVPVVEVS